MSTEAKGAVELSTAEVLDGSSRIEVEYALRLMRLCDPKYNAWLTQVPTYKKQGFLNQWLLNLFSQQIFLLHEYERKPVYGFLKRIFDWIGAAVLMLAFSPILIIAALAVRFSSPGPILFKQVRIGFLGRPFWVLKFRTMFEGADRQPRPGVKPLEKDLSDRRLTTVGNFLRKYKIDELPQLINVLRGEMSLVGPRPLPVEESAVTPEEYVLRFAVRPGLTGLWQATRPNTISGQLKIVLDQRYVRERSFLLDLKLLFLTIMIVVQGEKPLPRHASAESQPHQLRAADPSSATTEVAG